MKNRRRIPVCLLVLFALAAVSGQVMASPAYFGYTGLMMTPTADTLKTGGVDVGAYFLNDNNRDTSFLSANVGLLDSLEVGAAMISPQHGDSNGILNAKLGLIKETIATPAVAIGMSDLTGQLDATPYAVVTKSLPLQGQSLWAPRVSIGVGGGRLNGVFGGLSAKIADRVNLWPSMTPTTSTSVCSSRLLKACECRLASSQATNLGWV